MAAVLVCTHALDVDLELGGTILGRNGVERHVTGKPDQARVMLTALRPALVVVDRDLPWADRFIAAVRESPETRALSIAVVAKGDFDPAEITLLEAGANAILRLPPGPEWDERLPKLMTVPVRKETRFSVSFRVDRITAGGHTESALALNLSTSGILLESPAHLAIADPVHLRFQLPDGGEVEARGRVVRMAGGDRYGVEFQDMEPAHREKVRGFIATLA